MENEEQALAGKKEVTAIAQLKKTATIFLLFFIMFSSLTLNSFYNNRYTSMFPAYHR